MPRGSITAALLALAIARAASAHFVFIVPQPGGEKADVFLSEDLRPDANVKPDLVAGLTLSRRAAGHDAPALLTPGEKAYTVDLNGTRLIYGRLDLGVMQRGESKPYHLLYYPKTIVGDALDTNTKLGPSLTPIEIVPDGTAQSLWLTVRIAGRPAPAGTEVHVIKPDASQAVFATDADGRTEPFAAAGRYGAWARSVDAMPGTVGDKPFAETRRYATLVFVTGAAPTTIPATHPGATRPAAALAPVRTITPLPEAVSSFGAVVCGDALYVYGGHTAVTHSYDTTAVSKQFHRLNLKNTTAKWETLPGGPGLQGMNLATSQGKVYRVGGMEPRNPPGAEADNFSLAQAAVFDPAVGRWADLPPLPAGRSSHDVVVSGGQLFVIGGWTMRGEAGDTDWPDTMLVMDLTAAAPAWTEIKQPFKRRALIAAAAGGKIYVFGGFTEDGDPSKLVDVYDVTAGTWTRGPELPGDPLNGFAPAAAARGEQLFVSVGDGSLYRLDGHAWTLVAKTTPRIVHRLAVSGDDILVLGGAAKGKNFDLIEAVTVGR